MSKALHCYLVFHVAVFRKSLELQYWEGIAVVWFCRSYSILQAHFSPFFGQICTLVYKSVTFLSGFVCLGFL